jgi:hypothetical protein
MSKCQHKYIRGAQAGQECKSVSKTGDYCAKHKKKEPRDTDLSNDEVFATKSPPAEKSKFKFSAFRFTLNSQQDYEKMSHDDKAKFKAFVEFVFSPERVANFLIDRNSPEDAKKNIVELKSEFYFEVGGTQGRLHTHGATWIKHTGYYHFDLVKVRKLAIEIFGKGIYLDVKATGDANAAWDQYIQKSQGASKVEV